jgi:hypothetical protein
MGMTVKHPFVLVAVAGMTLSAINFLLLLFLFPETHCDRRPQKDVSLLERWMPLLAKSPSRRVQQINLAYFLFLFIFSGMEFTLTFLSFERFRFSGMQNAYLFLFSGVVMVVIQGGVVRRRASEIGELRLIKMGIMSVATGLILIAVTHHIWLLFGGLLFLSTGSALLIPCLTAIVTMGEATEIQGRVVGVFRSLGALARVLGPIMMTLLYWNLGGRFSYLIGSFMMILPWIILKRVEN